MKRTCLSIILAAGEGTRMKSSKPKVLHEIAGLPLVCHVVQQMQNAGTTELAIVVGRGAEDVAAAVKDFANDASIYQQHKRLGTAHAVLAARDAFKKAFDDVLIVFGDTPLIEADALKRARHELANGADIVVMGFKTTEPFGYGRLIEKDNKLIAIVEEKDASDYEKTINFCNGGLMAVNGKKIIELLDKVENKNSKQEYYLTDIVALGVKQGLNIQAIEVPFDNVIGINTRLELAMADQIWQARKAKDLMLSGVTLQKPETIYFSYDTKIEADVIVEPNVYFGKNVEVCNGAIIHAFSHIAGAIIGESVEVGPYARLRPGARLEKSSRVGNFCEVKNTTIGEGAKINHLSYIGDTVIGAGVNIGAGTITCNYDGFNKWKTIIEDNAFIGSNSSLVAPVKIGAGAYVASGSVITENVPNNSLAFGRAQQTIKQDRATMLRERFAKIKKDKAK